MDTIADTPTSRRAIRRFAARPTIFHELAGGETLRVGPLLQALDDRTERVYLVGPRPGRGTIEGFRRWADGPHPHGWVEHQRGHYLEGEHPILRFQAPDGRLVELLRAAAWFGEGDYPAIDAEQAWTLVGDELGRAFPRATLLASAAATGRELFLQTIPYGTSWPTLDPDTQQLIRSTSGQGRTQLLDHPASSIDELVVYDGRLMYAALCWGLPGAGRLQRVDEYLGQVRARYHATATVPRDWNDACTCGAPGHAGIGLLGVKDDAAGWTYPFRPAETLQGWWDGAELHVALAHGWQIRPTEAVVFDPYTGAGPLDGWAKRLIGCRERIDLRLRDTPVGALGRNAVRAIILHAIGAFTGASHRVTRSVTLDQAMDVPADARDVRVEGERVVWAEYTGPGWPELSHPEWSAAIWARARARLLDGPAGRAPINRSGALNVPAGDVLAFRTDALYLTRDPHWADDGKPGRLRHVHTVRGPISTPRTSAEILALAP